jgi:hypothetical protein
MAAAARARGGGANFANSSSRAAAAAEDDEVVAAELWLWRLAPALRWDDASVVEATCGAVNTAAEVSDDFKAASFDERR